MRGQATHDLERAFAYNLMHHVGVGEPISGHIDQTFKAGDFSWRVEHEILEAAGVFEFAGGGAQPHHRRLWDLSDPESRRKLLEFVERRKQAPPDLHAMDELDLHAMGELEKRIRESIADMFNRLLPRRDLYEPEAWDGVELGDEASMLLDRGIGGLGQSDIARLNRLLIEAAFPFLEADLWPQFFSDVNCIALWTSSEKILTRLYSVLHWFHKRLEVNVKKPRENRCFQTVIVFSFGVADNSKQMCSIMENSCKVNYCEYFCQHGDVGKAQF